MSVPRPSEAPIERVLSIDPALRNTGWAIVEKQGPALKLIMYGVIKNAPKLLPSGCLVAIPRATQRRHQAIRPHRLRHREHYLRAEL